MNIVQATSLKSICRYGRPLWGVWIKAYAEKKKIKKVAQGKIIQIAMEKLIGNRDLNTVKLVDLKANDVIGIIYFFRNCLLR